MNSSSPHTSSAKSIGITMVCRDTTPLLPKSLPNATLHGGFLPMSTLSFEAQIAFESFYQMVNC